MKDYIVFSISNNKTLAKDFAKFWNCQLGKVVIKKFADGETLVKIGVDVLDKDVIVIESTFKKINDRLVDLLMLLDSLNRGGAKSISLFIPYMGYSRQERVNNPHEPISAEVMAKIIETGEYNKLLTFDLHHPVIEQFFKRGIKNLPTTELFINYYKQYCKEKDINLSDVAVVSPDHGANKRADMLMFGLRGSKKVILEKTRPESDKAEHLSVNGDVRDKTCIIIDDVISTGNTIISATKLLKKAGAKQVLVAASHGVFAKTAIDDIKKAGAKDIVVTNTIEQELPTRKVHVLDILPLIMKEI